MKKYGLRFNQCRTEQDRRVVWQDFTTGRDHLKLVCHPFYERQALPKKLDYFRCYDLLGLGMPKRGNWDIALSLTGTGDDVRLVMERHYASLKKKGTRPRPVHFDTRELPLYYNRGENCIHVGLENQDDEAMLKAVTEYEKTDSKKKVQREGAKRVRKAKKNVPKSRGPAVRKLSRRGGRAVEGKDRGHSNTAEAQLEAATQPEDPVEVHMQETSLEMISHEKEIDSQFRRAIVQSANCDSSTASTTLTPLRSESPPAFPVLQDTDRFSTAVLSTMAPSCSTANERPTSLCSSFYGDDSTANGDGCSYQNRSTPKGRRATRPPKESALDLGREECWADVFSLSPY